MNGVSFGLMAVFALAHTFSKYLCLLRHLPRNRVLSASGGLTIAYVFSVTLPELSEHQQNIESSVAPQGQVFAYMRNHAYLISMLGLVVSYGLEHLVNLSKKRNVGGETASERVFWIHICYFFIFNAVTSYLLLHREYSSNRGMVFYVIAMSLYLLVNDWNLRRHHDEVYDRKGRWLLLFGIVFGWGVSLAVDLPAALTSSVFAFLSGGMIFNTIKGEFPVKRESSFTAFAVGCAVYTFVWLLVE